MNLKYIVKNNEYENINQILKQEFHISARLQRKLILNNHIFLNNTIVDTRSSIRQNDIITINLDFDEDSENIIPTQMKLDIIYEDDSFLILNKPSGITVHPSMSHYNDSLSNGVKYYFKNIGLKRKIRPVNRLDLDTSGVIVFAKNEYVQECLIQQMNLGIFKKDYIAICIGHFENSQGTINLPIARKEGSLIERCVSDSGQSAITNYKVLNEFKIDSKVFSTVRCSLKTGRTHQIRVHMSAVGHPLLGDSLYGCEFVSNLINRQALHSFKISFVHPVTNEYLELMSSLPYDIEQISKSVSRVLSFKIVIYLEHILLYASSHAI